MTLIEKLQAEIRQLRAALAQAEIERDAERERNRRLVEEIKELKKTEKKNEN